MVEYHVHMPQLSCDKLTLSSSYANGQEHLQLFNNYIPQNTYTTVITHLLHNTEHGVTKVVRL